jgi:hypothetical protein
MGRAALATPVYISLAWTLMISYQLFTQTAVNAVTIYINILSPAIGTWLTARIDTIVFIYAFAWVFVLSSVIPSILLGKGRSVLIQFLVCLTLTFVALTLQDILTTHASISIAGLFNLTSLLQNPILAAGYLLMPYIFMITLDIRARKKQQKTEKLTQLEPAPTPTSTSTSAPNDEPKTEEAAQKRQEEAVAAT